MRNETRRSLPSSYGDDGRICLDYARDNFSVPIDDDGGTRRALTRFGVGRHGDTCRRDGTCYQARSEDDTDTDTD
jgi:hypothetical protein